MNQSVWFLSYIITRRIVVTNNKVSSASTARNHGAPEPPRPAPHDLRVVAALVTPCARVGPVPVPAAFGGPRCHRLGRVPARAAPPEDVLAVGPAGVDQGAVALADVGVLFGVPGQARVPRQRRQPDRGADGVVWA